MPFDFRRDDQRHIVWVRNIDPLTVGDVTAMLDQQIAEGTWQFGLLVDARTAALSGPDSKALLQYLSKLAVLHGPPGPVALVTRDAVGSAQSYAIRCDLAGFSFEVFWDVEEAAQWLQRIAQRSEPASAA